MRILSWLGGILAGFGLALEVISVGNVIWFKPPTVVSIAVGAFVVLLLIRTAVKSAPIRSGLSAAAWTTLAFLLLYAPTNATHDTKEKGYRTQMVAQLLETRDAERKAFLDSGRYTLSPALLPGWHPDSAPEIVMTRDGWTASVDYSRVPEVVCVIFEGSVALAPATEPGEPRCTVSPFPWAAALLPGLALMIVGATLVGAVHRGQAPKEPVPGSSTAVAPS